MSASLEDYPDLLAALGPRAGDVLRASWQEAARSFSSGALEKIYLEGARTLHALGRGGEPVETFLQEAPEVARELGDDAVRDLLDAAVRCASKTSATVIGLLICGAPAAAKRLGERELFRGYLRLIETLLAQVPRGVRPLLENLDALLGQLTLGGLRRWAAFGAQAHRTDFEAQQRYFALASPDSVAVLQAERRGTLFVDVQRRLGMYLRALWGREFFLRPTSGDYEAREGYRPFIENFLIHVPDAYDDCDGVAGLEIYRAAAAHAAAHIAYTHAALSAEQLNPLQTALVGLVEDARVEALAIRDFPGLKALWSRLHIAPGAAQRPAARSVAEHLDRLALALLDERCRDDSPPVAMARKLFRAAQDRLGENRISWEIGVELANALAPQLARAGLSFNPRTDQVRAAYRDDNRYFWQFAPSRDDAARPAPWLQPQVRRKVGLMEFVNEIEVETAGDDAQEVWILPTELFPYEDDGVSYNRREGKEPAPEPHHYPEWDYQVQAERPHWVTLYEGTGAAGDAAQVEEALARHKPLAGRLKHLIEALQPQGVQRVRRLEDGDDIDLNAAISALVQIHRHEPPDPRVMMRSLRRTRDLAVLLLIDLSESTSDLVRGSDRTVLDLARDATALMAEAMRRVGDPFAIHGFSSDGRHEVRYTKFKDFDDAYDAAARARLAGMRSGMSTRMGAPLRHAGALLARRPQARRLLLVLTDGEPADVDVQDPQYLRADARKAVEGLLRQGIATFCLSLDPQADRYVSRIFGARNYRVLDRVERLPEQLPGLYLGLAR